eukprot:3445696-Rhodomonas_salina.1
MLFPPHSKHVPRPPSLARLSLRVLLSPCQDPPVGAASAGGGQPASETRNRFGVQARRFLSRVQAENKEPGPNSLRTAG